MNRVQSERPDDPLHCQTRPPLTYAAFVEDDDRRKVDGETEAFCVTCTRWRWIDEQCRRFVVSESPENKF